MTITEVYGELYRQVRVSVVVPYSTTSITVSYGDLHHYHCRLWTSLVISLFDIDINKYEMGGYSVLILIYDALIA